MLNKLCVLITRPQPQANELAELIVAEGGEAVVHPTFSIENLANKKALQIAIERLDKVDIIIFISPNAVQKTLPLLQQTWPKLPEKLLIAAVGKSTKKALNAYGLKSILCPETECNSEGLLSLAAFKHVENKIILIFQGETGRGLLENVLTNRGADVRLVLCYRRVLTESFPASTVINWQKIGINCIVYTSAEGMLNLFKLVDENFHYWLKSLSSVVVSKRLAEIAKALKIDNIIQSEDALAPSIIKALKKCRDISGDKENMSKNESPPTALVENNPSQHVKKCPYKGWLAVFAFILSIIAICMITLIGKLAFKETQQLKSNNIIVNNVVGKMQQELSTMQTEIKNQQSSIQEVINQTKLSRTHWAYAEASYLIQQAIYQLRLDNSENTIGLLGDAVDVVDKISTPNKNSLENRLLTAINTLKTTPKVDRNALISQIDQLSQQVDTLSLSLPETSSAAIINSAKTTFSGHWKFFKESWEHLKQLIVIRHHEKPLEPLITPQQDVYLKQNIQLQLEKASIAVLYRDPTLYLASLKKADSWVKQFFNLHTNSAQTFLKTTSALLQINIAPTVPNVITSLKTMLNEIKPFLETTPENVAIEKFSSMKMETTKNLRKTQEVSA